MLRAARVLALVGGALVPLACAPLPDLPAGTCGNFVIDVGEDCDGHANGASHCGEPDSASACRFVCGEAGDVCPEGYGCGADGVCRIASGEIRISGESVGITWPQAIRVSDFDADGQADLLMVGGPDAVGRRPARAYFSDGFRLSEGLDELPLRLAVPTVGAGTGENALRDVAFADFEGMALLRGHEDRHGHYSMFPTILLPDDTFARVLFVDVLPSLLGDEIVSLYDDPMSGAYLMGISAGGASTTLATVPGADAEEDLGGKRAYFNARFDETLPCEQVVLAYRGGTEVFVFSPCRMGAEGAEWNVGGALEAVTLSPPVAIDEGAFATDVDLDGHMDLVVGAGGYTHVSYGQGDGTFVSAKVLGFLNVAERYELPKAAGGPAGFPLAMGDLDADGVVDFVVPRGVAVSGPSGYEVSHVHLGGSWTEAVIADFNGNGLPDVVASVEGVVDLDFLNNAGEGIFAPATLSTQGPPRLLTVGDFDGDLLADVAFCEELGEEGEIFDHVAFAFGAPFGPPASIAVIGEAGNIEQIAAGQLVGADGLDAMEEVALVFEDHARNADGVALLQGRTSRGIYSTLPLRYGDASYVPVALAFGKFGDDTADVAAVAAEPKTGALRLFRAEAFEDGPPGLPTGSAPFDAGFLSAEPLGPVDFRYGAYAATADLDDDGVDEVVALAPYGGEWRSALVIAHYDEEKTVFEVGAPRRLEAELAEDAGLRVVDLDGDGHEDALFTTRSGEGPSELWVLWGGPGDALAREDGAISKLSPDELGVHCFATTMSPRGGGLELYVSTTGGIHRYSVDAGRKFSGEKIPGLPSARAIAFADFDRDGVEDIALQSEEGLELHRSVPERE